MKHEKKLHIRVSETLTQDLDQKSKEIGISKSEFVRNAIEEKVYNENNVFLELDTPSSDSPLYSSDFLTMIISLTLGMYMSRAYQHHVDAFIKIIKRDFDKLDEEMKSILIPLIKDLARLVDEMEEKPDSRHYYKFEIDLQRLRTYLKFDVNLIW